MFALIKRVLDLAGSFSPAARRSLTWGMVCNILKAFFMAGMLGAVFWALENRDHLDAVVALQCLGILAVSGSTCSSTSWTSRWTRRASTSSATCACAWATG